MGKNSAHRRKQNQAKYNQRMASDVLAAKAEKAERLTDDEEMHLTQLLQDLVYESESSPATSGAIAEANALQDAANTLERTRRNAQLFTEAGVPEAFIDPELGLRYGMDSEFLPSGMPGGKPIHFMDVGGLGLHHPMPVIDKKSMPGVERRIHTQYQYIPELGRTEVVPVIHEGTGKALVTEIGDAGKYPINTEGHTRGSEYMQDRILRLLGAKDLVVENQGDKYAVDFRGRFEDETGVLPDEVSGIDGEMRWSSLDNGRALNALPIQLFTQVHPRGWERMDEQQIRSTTKRLISDALRKNPSLNIEGAIQVLEEEGRIVGRHTIPGKAIKSSHDALIMPGYVARDAVNNKNKDKRPNIMAPETVHYVSLNDARSYIAQKRGRDAERILQTRYSRGERGDGALRARVYADVPLSVGENVVTGLPGDLGGPVGQVLKSVRPAMGVKTTQELELNPAWREGIQQLFEQTER